MQEQLSDFQEYLRQQGNKRSKQRLRIAQAFFAFEGHPTAEELLNAARLMDPKVGQATVYRTLKLLCEAGLAREMNFGGGVTRFDRLEQEEHHDHFICEQCGATFGFFSAEIERLQDEIARQHSFTPTRHRLYLYGICAECRTSQTRRAPLP